MKNILYIAGYGRSGSTILALLLACPDKVTSIGEVGALHRALRESRPCTCSTSLEACSFWGDLVRRSPHSPSEDLRKRGADVRVAIDYAFDRSGAEVLVDATKTSYRNAFRPWKLYRAGYQIYMIGLVRGLGAVTNSSMKGRNSALEAGAAKPERFIRTRVLLSWSVANLAAMVYALVPGIKYVSIRYEDLVRDPVAVIAKIEHLTGRDFSASRDAAMRQLPLESGHEINGNRVLRGGPIRLKLEGVQ